MRLGVRAALPIAMGCAALAAGTTIASTAALFPQAPSPARAAAAPPADVEARIVCGTSCHRLPPPDILPSASWRDEISRMAFIREGRTEPPGPPGTASRSIVLPDDMQRVLRWYQASAPQALPAPSPWPDVDARRFTRRSYSPEGAPASPAVSHVRAVDVDGDGRLEIVASDMRYGLLLGGSPGRASTGRLDVLARLPHPAHFSLVDLDGDGIRDFLVADLGRFLPSDHTEGAVVWLRGTASKAYLPLSIDGWPRVADVEAGDFNGDGKPDLAVAAFGWRKVGRISILENRTTSYDHPSFSEHVIDPRAGGVHAIPVDLDKDGRLDLVTLLAQQYETIVAFMGTERPFELSPREIYTAPHPNWGSSGIQVIDLDGDGDLDVLFTHGDTFDDQIIKPYHGIQWLENRGTFPFTEHALAELPGVFRAEAGDLDADGDLDIVACAFIAAGSNLDESTMPSLVWLEQVRPGVFERRTLERTAPRHATLDVADVDGDGDLDIVVGNFMTDGRPAPYVEVWENRRR